MRMTLDQALVLKVGDKFWIVTSNNNAFNRIKVKQVIDGVEWFRYDKPLKSHTVYEVSVNAIVETKVEGQSRYEDESLCIEYRCENDKTVEGFIDIGDTIYPSHPCFLTQEDAEAECARFQENSDDV